MLWGDFPNQVVSYPEALAAGGVPDSEQRAMVLLGSIVKLSDFNRYAATGTLLVLGQVTGTTYIIRRSETTIVLDSLGEQTFSYCIHSAYNDHVPKTDDVIALWLMISGYESRFLSVANRSNTYSSGEAYREQNEITPDKLDDDSEDELADNPGIIYEDGSILRYERESEPSNGLDEQLSNVRNNFRTNEEIGDHIACRYRTFRQARSGRLAYDIDVDSAAYQLWEFELSGMTPTPTLDVEARLITQGVGLLCLYLDRIPDVPIVNYSSPDGDKRVSVVKWQSWKDVDDAVIGALLSAYVLRLHTAIVNTPRNEVDATVAQAMCAEPTSPLTKCIMSSESYQLLTGNSLYPPFLYEHYHVIIDDRMENVVLMFADAINLGAIPYSDQDKYGITILEPANVIACHIYGNRLYPLSCEGGIDIIYGQFPDGNSAAMDYNQRLDDAADPDPINETIVQEFNPNMIHERTACII